MAGKKTHAVSHPTPPEPLVNPLKEYALIADGERGALIGPRGDVAWMCFPTWGDDAVFSGLLLGPGTYIVTPDAPSVWGGHYEDGSLIWRSRWASTFGVSECHEALAKPAFPRRATLLRRMVSVDRDVRFFVRLAPAPRFGQVAPPRFKKTGPGIFEGRAGGVWIRWSNAHGARPHDRGLVLHVELRPQEVRDLVLELSPEPFRDPVPSAEALWAQTRHEWGGEVPEFEHMEVTREVRTSAAVLVGMTSRGGGMVAAATTSLPERAERHRNYDYRYCWLRDQCYAGLAAKSAQMGLVLDASVKFVAERILANGADLKPVYTVQGHVLPRESPLHLPGYPGAGEVRRGNRAGQQFQLDTLGEALLLFAGAHDAGRLTREGHRAAELTAEIIARRWQEPDAGIWELEDHLWTQSRLICAAGLRQLARFSSKAARRKHLDLANALVRFCRVNATRDDGAWQRSIRDVRVDAAVLPLAWRGAYPGPEPRTAATLAAVERELVRDGFVYRFRHDEQPLGAAEGAFLLCQFWLALAYLAEGDRTRALQLFERGRGATGGPGLFAEEFDVEQHQQRGNLPQAFVHAVMLETAMALYPPPT